MAKKLTQEAILLQFKEKHGDRYDYSLVEYINGTTKVKIICSEHGIFEKQPELHKKGIGCQKCAYRITNESKTTNQTNVIMQFNLTHNGDFDYTMVEYKNARSKIKIKCIKHDHIFEQRPDAHAAGRNGCDFCKQITNTRERFKNIKTTLYYVKIDQVYKIGITTKPILERFSQDIRAGKDIELIMQKSYTDGSVAFDNEQYILKLCEKYKYEGVQIIVSGNTELFSSDIRLYYDIKL